MGCKTKKIIEIQNHRECIFRYGQTYESEEAWTTFITCKKLRGIICPNCDNDFPNACPLEDAHHVIRISDTKECPYAGMFNLCLHSKRNRVVCHRFKTDKFGRILTDVPYPPPENCPLEEA